MRHNISTIVAAASARLAAWNHDQSAINPKSPFTSLRATPENNVPPTASELNLGNTRKVQYNDAGVARNPGSNPSALQVKGVKQLIKLGSPIPRKVSDQWDGKTMTGSDAHCHPDMNYSLVGHHPQVVVQGQKDNRMPRITKMPIPTNIVSIQGDYVRFDTDTTGHGACGCDIEYYLPAQHYGNVTELTPELVWSIANQIELKVNGAVDEQSAHAVKQAVESGAMTLEEREHIHLAITGLDLGDPRAHKELLKLLARHPGTFDMVGEITIHKELVDHLYAGKAPPDLEHNIAPLRRLLQTAGVVGLPTTIHCDIDKPALLKQSGEGPRVYAEGLRRFFKACPNAPIIHAHCGGLGRFVKPHPTHFSEMRQDLEDPELSHVKYDISWSHVATAVMSDEGDPARGRPPFSKQLADNIIDHPDRFLFGSDTLTPKDNATWAQTYNVYNPTVADQPNLFHTIREQLLARANGTHPDGHPLPQAVQDAIATGISAEDATAAYAEEIQGKVLHGNFVNTITNKRHEVRLFEKYVLPHVEGGLRDMNAPLSLCPNALNQEAIDRFTEARDELRRKLHQSVFKEAAKTVANVFTFGKTHKAYDISGNTLDEYAREVALLDEMIQARTGNAPLHPDVDPAQAQPLGSGLTMSSNRRRGLANLVGERGTAGVSNSESVPLRRRETSVERYRRRASLEYLARKGSSSSLALERERLVASRNERLRREAETTGPSVPVPPVENYDGQNYLGVNISSSSLGLREE